MGIWNIRKIRKRKRKQCTPTIGIQPKIMVPQPSSDLGRLIGTVLKKTSNPKPAKRKKPVIQGTLIGIQPAYHNKREIYLITNSVKDHDEMVRPFHHDPFFFPLDSLS